MLTGEEKEELHVIVDEMLGRTADERPRGTILTPADVPFDVAKANSHDSKKEFLNELRVVEQAIEHLSALLSFLEPEEGEPQPQDRLKRNLLLAVERSQIGRSDLAWSASAQALVMKNLRETGFAFNALDVLKELRYSYRKHLIDLKDQEARFWNVSHRPPNYYARMTCSPEMSSI